MNKYKIKVLQSTVDNNINFDGNPVIRANITSKIGNVIILKIA